MRWPALVVSALGAALWLVPAGGPPALRSGAYVQSVGPTSAVVARIEPEPRALRLVVEGPDGTRFEAAAAPRRRHALRVGGLRPATRYRFTLLDAVGAAVDEGGFRTAADADNAPLRFAVTGDSGGQPFWIWTQGSALGWVVFELGLLPAAGAPTAVGEALAAARPDFWLHVGDVVYPSGAQRHYPTGFFRPFAAALRQAPCYPVLGNHDVMTDRGRPFLRNFVLPADERSRDGRCYTFRDGPLRVVALDVNSRVGDGHPALRYLDEVLAASAEPWSIVAVHYPIDTAYRDEPRGDLLRHLLPRLRRLGVDVLVSGHDHNYQRFGEPGELVQVVSGGGGKSLYPVRSRPANLVVAESAYHYCEVEVDGPVMRWTARRLDGGVIDRFVIDKAALRTSGALRLDAARPRDRRVAALIDARSR